jgi:energy-coupling factor transport system ATP-binding protein
MIKLENVTFRYPKAGENIVDGLNMEFMPGVITALTGKNGCGKTTVTKLIVGILRPLMGRVSIDGIDTAKLDLFDIGHMVGYVFQDPSRQLFCDSVINEVKYGLLNMGLSQQQAQKRAMDQLEIFHIANLAQKYPGKLSQGEKQRTALACVLSMNTGYVVLDEPTTGLDMRSRRELGEMLVKIRNNGKGVVIVSHEEEFIRKYADMELCVDEA